jgi:hypothetical protein
MKKILIHGLAVAGVRASVFLTASLVLQFTDFHLSFVWR